MKKISDFLGKFIKLAEDSDTIKKIVAETLFFHGIQIQDIQKIKVQGRIASIQLSPAQKNELFFKQKKIISDLSKNPLTKNIEIIR